MSKQMKNTYKDSIGQITAKPQSGMHQEKSDKKWFVAFCFALLGFVTLAFYHQNSKTNEIERPEIKADIIPESSKNLATNEKSTILNGSTLKEGIFLEVSGYAVATHKSSISSDITGRIKKIELEIGDKVKEGDVIALLDDEEALIRLKERNLSLLNKDYELQKAQLEYKNKASRFKRLKELAVKNSISAETLELAEKDFNDADIIKRVAKVNKELAENQLKSAQIFLDKHTIRVPFDAVVIDVFAKEGEAISPSSSGNGSIRSGLVRLVDPKNLYVEAEVPEKYLTKLFVGQSVLISVPNQETAELVDQVKWISPVSSRQRGLVQVGINLPNGINNIVDGMELNVSFIQFSENIAQVNK